MNIRIPLITSILTLILSTVGTTTVSAMESGPWDFREMTIFNHKVESLKDAYCEEHPNPYMPEMCYYEFTWDGEEKNKYDALSGYNMYGLILTAVNPSKNTFRIYFNGTELEYKRMGFAPENYLHDLSELYIAQFDKDYPIGVYWWDDIKKSIDNPHRYTVYDSSAMKDEGNWVPSNQEVELPMKEFSLNPKTSRHLRIYYKTTIGISYELYYDLSSCIDSSDYQDGMECQIRYSNTGNIVFFVPSEPVDIASNPFSGNEIIISQDENNNSASTNPQDEGNVPINLEPQIEEVASATDSVNEGAEIDFGSEDSSTAATAQIKTPETGTNTAESCSKIIAFPWWLAVLLVVGDAVLVWWFMPKRKNK